jgi:hypothetical protein
MRLTVRTGLILLLACGESHAGPSQAELKAVNEQPKCEHPRPGHVVYRGESQGLAACLEQVGEGRIEELRISSGGGGAWETLRLMQRFAGRIELVVVDRLCASSCANYVIPAARRLRVEPDSHVLLHGSPNLRDIDPQEASVLEQLRAGIRAGNPQMSDTEVNQRATEGWNLMRNELIQMIPVQESWARGVLKCDDWLDPHRHLQEPLPSWTSWLLVTPEMAERCLRATEVVEFWSPRPESEYAREVGFLRARR